jgi:hypothetical protein
MGLLPIQSNKKLSPPDMESQSWQRKQLSIDSMIVAKKRPAALI